MLKDILPLIPLHKIYVEPYFGGGAVFWAKEPAPSEIINDINMNVVNFYEVLQTDYKALYDKLKQTLHSRETYKKASLIYHCPWLFADDKVIRAWAFWVATNQGFANKIGSWGYARSNRAKTIQNKIDAFKEDLTERLRQVQIEQHPAHKVIKSRDDKETFFYCDPPYVGSNQGHYSGYSERQYRYDLSILAQIKGKFMLSSYPNPILNDFVKTYKRKVFRFDKALSATNGRLVVERSRKMELLVVNYNPEKRI